MNVLEWSQQISHCKSMQILNDAQGKLTPQSKVVSTLNLAAQGQLTIAGGWVLGKIKLIQAFMVVLVTRKNEYNLFKN